MTIKYYDKALYRLTTIVSRLLMGEALDVKELAEEFNVSVRTIQKDLNQRLIYWDITKDKNGRYVLFKKPGNLKHFNILDLLARELISSFLTGLEEHFIDPSKKIFTDLDHPAIITNFSIQPLENHIKKLVLLYQAIHFKQSIVFSYVNKKNEQKLYFVNPYKLALLDGYWYLLGFCKTDEKIKTFYLKNISQVRVSPENFKPDTKLILQIEVNIKKVKSAWIKPDMKTVRLKIQGDAYCYLSRNMPSSLIIEKKEQDFCLARMKYFQETEVLLFIKKWLPDVIVLDKPDLNQKLEKMLLDYLQRMGSR
ncbi:helix-turn-helix transcriptional regulator [Desulfonauticus submarinus]